MNKTVSYCALIVASGVMVTATIAAPHLISDNNVFLRDFVNHELLNTLGVILAITLASAGQLHLALNKIEEDAGKSILTKTRAKVHKSAYWMVGLFLAAVAIVLIKPLLGSPTYQAALNGASVVIVLWTVLFMISLTRLFFAIKPDLE